MWNMDMDVFVPCVFVQRDVCRAAGAAGIAVPIVRMGVWAPISQR